MTILVPETSIEKDLKEKSKKMKKMKKLKKEDFIVNLYNGLPGIPGTKAPEAPVTDIVALAKALKDAEDQGYFRVKVTCKLNRDEIKCLKDVRWYLCQAFKSGLIVKKTAGV